MTRVSSSRVRLVPVPLALALAAAFLVMPFGPVAGATSADPDRVFWTNGWESGQGYPGTVNRVNRDGTGATVLISGLGTVGDIEVDPINGHLYFNQWVRPTNNGFDFGDPSEGLWRSDLDGVGAVLFSNSSNASECFGWASGLHGISLDLANEVVYFTRGVSYADWCDGPEISRVNFDGTGYARLNGPGQDGWFLSGVDVDSTNGRVFWGSPGVISGSLDGAVNVVNTDGTSPATLVGHTNGLGRALALDSATGTIFFTAFDIFNPSSGGQIWRVGTDGTGLAQLPILGLTGVPDIEVDSAQQRIWFTDFWSGTIQSANFDGTGLVTEFTGLDHPLGLALEFDLNEDPECTNAAPSVNNLWPPNHKFVDINVLGVTDPDGDVIAITVDSIFQDEATDTLGDGAFTPDATGVGTDTAAVRAERSGSKKVPGDGRVYTIAYTADDGNGGSCSGTVTVGVPHDVKDTALDGGALFDSTI